MRLRAVCGLLEFHPDRPDPERRTSGKCALRGCTAKIPKKAAADEAFCSTECCKLWHGVERSDFREEIGPKDYVSEYKAVPKPTRRRRTAADLSEDDPAHGTKRGYVYYGCKCGRCKAAYASYQRGYQRKPDQRAKQADRQRHRRARKVAA